MRDYKREAEISEALKELDKGLKSHNLELAIMEGPKNTFGGAVFVVLDKDTREFYRFDKEYRLCKA